ncbi:MAG: HD domain-containing protein [Oscillospiraceae bacterium]|nr:HD domain-containing protein [Oscillospiraceae bacterium]
MAGKDMEKALAIAEKVAREGGRSFFVGGFVRDRIRGEENKDIDMEVHRISFEKLQEILESEGRCIVIGAGFGIFSLKGFRLDVAMPRTEKTTGRGHRDFAVDVDPFIGEERAAARRDFTMNALMQDVLTGEILDFTGGISDIRNRIIRHVDPRSFGEDPLRALRGCQFAARFGYSIAEETVALCREMDLSALPGERVFEELKKALLQADCPSVFFEELRRMDGLAVWFAELEKMIGVPQDPVFHPEGDVWNHTMRTVDEAAKLRSMAREPLYFMLAALCHDMGKPAATQEINGRFHAYGHDEGGVATAERFLRKITAEKRLIAYVCDAVRLHMRPNMLVQQKASDKAYRRLFDQSCVPEDLLLLAKADYLASLAEGSYRETERKLREQLEGYRRLMERPYVQAKDLLEAGVQPGPDIREGLAYLHKLRLADVDREEALTQTLGHIRARHRSDGSEKNRNADREEKKTGDR